MQLRIQSIFSIVIVGALAFSHALVADASKCSPCQLKKSIQEALAQSIKDAQMAALAAGGAFVKASELDIDADATRGCGCTKRDETIAEINPSEEIVVACCDFCAQPGSLGCQGLNSANCVTCIKGLAQMSLAEVAATALALAQNVIDQAAQLDALPVDQLPTGVLAQAPIRAPRQALADPCNNCGSVSVAAGSCDSVSEQLKALRCCCASVAHQLARQGKDAKKCCKRLHHKLDDVEDLVETLIDQSAACCSVTETILGDPTTASILDIPSCLSNSIVDGIINGTDADVMTWLKSIYELVYIINNVFACG